MAEYAVRVLDSAATDLADLDHEVLQRVTKRIHWLAENLDHIRPEPLTGDLSGLYKLRVGAYRVIYQALRDQRLILIHAVGHRRDIYRRW